MNRILNLVAFFVYIAASFSTMAFDELKEANKYFEGRNNLENVLKAQEIYVKLIKNTKENLEIRQQAMAKYGRLAVWYGAIAQDQFKLKNKDASKLYKTCIEVTESLNPKALKKEVPEYYYWQATCIGLYMANINPVKAGLHLGKIKDMHKLVKIGQEKFPKHDGYGFDRIEAGILFKSEMLKSIKLYDPPKALLLINGVIEHGTDLYMTYFLKAEVLVELHEISEAIEILDKAIADYDARFIAKSLPKDLKFENEIFARNMKILRDNLQRQQ